jgi:dTDP-4-dehydrorhamnose 3,5-epimerase
VVFTDIGLPGAFLIDIQPQEDERGFFARTFCEREFIDHGLEPRFVQCNVSLNHKRGTLRGLHYQAVPSAEAKLVRCTQGAIYDVVVDIRTGSPTYAKWVAVELTSATRRAVYVPKGMAHGFQTLTEEAEVFYQMSSFHEPAVARGIRWSDTELDIRWPLPPSSMSSRDAGLPLLREAQALAFS